MHDDDLALAEHGLRTTRYLIEAQLRLLSDVDPEGASMDKARATLRRLMTLETGLRSRAETLRDASPGASRSARVAG